MREGGGERDAGGDRRERGGERPAAPPGDRDAFMDALCTAADDPQGPVRVVFTVRDDFLVRVAGTPAARAALRAGAGLVNARRDA